MSINVDGNLDSEAKDAVAKVTDGKVKEKNGGWGRKGRKPSAVVDTCIWQGKKCEDVAKCANDDNKDIVEDKEVLTTHDILWNTILRPDFAIKSAVLLLCWGYEKKKKE